VGKTTLIKEFSKTYKHSILLNLEKPSDASYFKNYFEAKPLIEALFLSNNISIAAIHQVLLFIDEIQESPEAIQLLQYFYEDYPELHVIAASSLLEFAMKNVKSFPVGRVEYFYIYPLNFLEYLEARGHEAALYQMNKIPHDPVAHQVLLNLFNQYAIVGGMPEVIGNHIATGSVTELPSIYHSIWTTFKNDAEKYASNETERRVIKHIVNTAHLYLDQRIKFQNFGQSNYRSREVGEAMRSLHDARIIQLIYPTTDCNVPVKPDLRKSPKLQFLDTGLVNNELAIQSEMLAMKDLSNYYKGALIPHLITQELMSINWRTDKKPNFWIREKKQSTAEIDLVLSIHDLVIPIEIKSGKEGTLRSLHQYMERIDHPYAVRIYAGKYSVTKTKTPGGKHYLLMNLPYYLGTKLPAYVEHFVKEYHL